MLVARRRRVTASLTSVVLVMLACLAAVAAWTLPSSAATTQFVTNTSVESSLTPWTSPYNPSSRVERVSGGYDGSWAVRASNTASSSRDIGFKDSPRNVASTVTGQAYDVSVWVRSEVPGKTLTLRVKELTSGNTSTGTAVRSLQVPDTGWHQLQVTYTARATGNSLSFIVFGAAVAANQGFWADLFSASTTTPDPTSTGTSTEPTSTDPTASDPPPTDPTATEDPGGDGDLDVYALISKLLSRTNPDDVVLLNGALRFSPVAVPRASGVGDAVAALDGNGDGRTEFLVLNGAERGAPAQRIELRFQ